MAKRIEAKDLNIYYGDFHAVESVNFTVEPRTVTAFIGPSGCGCPSQHRHGVPASQPVPRHVHS